MQDGITRLEWLLIRVCFHAFIIVTLNRAVEGIVAQRSNVTSGRCSLQFEGKTDDEALCLPPTVLAGSAEDSRYALVCPPRRLAGFRRYRPGGKVRCDLLQLHRARFAESNSSQPITQRNVFMEVITELFVGYES